MQQILMQSPDVNPWTDKVKLIKEWSELRNNLIKIGIDVIVIPKIQGNDLNLSKRAFLFEDHAFISVFTSDKDSAVREVKLSDWIREHDFTPSNHYVVYCGEADTLIESNIVWYAFGRNSTFGYKYWLDKVFDKSIKTVRALQMHNDSLAVQPPIDYLNQCFCPLGHGKLMWYPEAFSKHSQMTIRTWFADRIEITSADLVSMACTAIVQGKNIIIPKVSNHLIRMLTESGFNVIVQDMPTLVDMGLGCKSLVINVNE
jgi:N-dimethylarginine dimethylaminohydrolase